LNSNGSYQKSNLSLLALTLGGLIHIFWSQSYIAKAQENPNRKELPPASPTKEDMEKAYQEALELEESGKLLEAAKKFVSIYNYYEARGCKDEIIVTVLERIGILNHFVKRPKKAYKAFEEAWYKANTIDLPNIRKTGIYFDLCFMMYHIEEFKAASTMFKACLDMAKLHCPDNIAMMSAIYQYMGFATIHKGDVKQGNIYLSQALRLLSQLKEDNKVYLFFAYNELADFFFGRNEHKKSLLLLKESSILAKREAFWEEEAFAKAMDVPSEFIKTSIKRLKNKEQLNIMQMKILTLETFMGPYNHEQEQKKKKQRDKERNQYDVSLHGLIDW